MTSLEWEQQPYGAADFVVVGVASKALEILIPALSVTTEPDSVFMAFSHVAGRRPIGEQLLIAGLRQVHIWMYAKDVTTAWRRMCFEFERILHQPVFLDSTSPTAQASELVEFVNPCWFPTRDIAFEDLPYIVRALISTSPGGIQ